MADFGLPDVPKLVGLPLAMLENDVYPPECKNPPCTWVVNVCFHMEKLPLVTDVRDFFSKTLVSYTKLCSVPNPKTGEWIPTSADWSYHVVGEEPDDPLRAIDRLLNISLDTSKPLWRVHLLPSSTPSERSLLVFRIHHCVTDGIHLSRLLSSLLAPGFSVGEYGMSANLEDAVSKNIKASMANASPKKATSVLGSLTQRLTLLPSVVTSFVGNMYGASLEDDSPLNRSKAERSNMLPYGGPRRVLLLPTHSVASVKAIRRASGSNFDAVVLSIYTGALRRLCEKIDPEFESKVAAAGGAKRFTVRATTPVPLPLRDSEFIDSQGLCNSFAVVSAPVALGEGTPKDRLTATQKSYAALRQSAVASVTAWQESHLLASLPASVRQTECLKYVSLHSMDFSSVPGPPMPGAIAGAPVASISIVLPQMLSQLIVLTYDGKVFPTLTYDPELLTSMAEEHLRECYREELRELLDAFNLTDEAPEVS